MTDDVSPFYSQEPGYLDERQSGPGPWDVLVDQRPPQPPAGADPYAHDNAHAIGVNQRAAAHWSGQTYTVDGTNPVKVVSGQKGRHSVTLLVPQTAAAGVYIDSSADTLSQSSPLGFLLVAGASISLETEDDIYAVSATSGTDTVLCVAVLWG